MCVCVCVDRYYRNHSAEIILPNNGNPNLLIYVFTKLLPTRTKVLPRSHTNSKLLHKLLIDLFT
jgi:hypothetical protein